MIEIYRFEPAWKVNASPFCLKVETYCQLAGIPYSVAFTQPVNGPRGLLPFIVDENKTIPDSSKIIKYLKEKYGDTLDANLSQEDHAKGYLLRQLCEQSLYFAILYSRWQDDDYWQ
jgi:glutathione S-transferase